MKPFDIQAEGVPKTDWSQVKSVPQETIEPSQLPLGVEVITTQARYQPKRDIADDGRAG
jgi:hypothetical protein